MNRFIAERSYVLGDIGNFLTMVLRFLVDVVDIKTPDKESSWSNKMKSLIQSLYVYHSLYGYPKYCKPKSREKRKGKNYHYGAVDH